MKALRKALLREVPGLAGVLITGLAFYACGGTQEHAMMILGVLGYLEAVRLRGRMEAES